MKQNIQNNTDIFLIFWYQVNLCSFNTWKFTKKLIEPVALNRIIVGFLFYSVLIWNCFISIRFRFVIVKNFVYSVLFSVADNTSHLITFQYLWISTCNFPQSTSDIICLNKYCIKFQLFLIWYLFIDLICTNSFNFFYLTFSVHYSIMQKQQHIYFFNFWWSNQSWSQCRPQASI